MELKEKLEAYSKVSPSGCWEWQRSLYTNGYGRICDGHIKRLAHRVSYEIHKGQIPDGLVVMHSCDNPKCCNPEHLTLGTQSDNLKDAVSKGRHHNGDRKYGLDNHFTKLTDKDIELILQSTDKRCVLANRFSVSATRISQIRNKGGR